MLDSGEERAELRSALLSLDRVRANDVVRRVRGSHTLPDVMDGLIVPVLEEIGVGWDKGRIALSEVYLSGRIASELVSSLLAAEPATFTRPQPRIGIVTLEDSHVLGKQIVDGLLATAGYHVDDLGQRVGVEETVRLVRERSIQVLLVSVLMMRSALRVQDLKHSLAQEGLAAVPVVVGGAPFRLDAALWREVGADACGRSASDAIEIIPTLPVPAA